MGAFEGRFSGGLGRLRGTNFMGSLELKGFICYSDQPDAHSFSKALVSIRALESSLRVSEIKRPYPEKLVWHIIKFGNSI